MPFFFSKKTECVEITFLHKAESMTLWSYKTYGNRLIPENPRRPQLAVIVLKDSLFPQLSASSHHPSLRNIIIQFFWISLMKSLRGCIMSFHFTFQKYSTSMLK